MSTITLNRIILLIVTIFLTGSLNMRAQTNNSVIINQGAGGATVVSPTGEIFINGISSREDVGGVEVSKGKYRGYKMYDLYFSNYNDFPVSVVYKLHAYLDGQIAEMTGSIVLQPGESKYSRDSYAEPHDFRLIARRMSGGNSVAQPSQNTQKPAEQSLDGILEKYGGYFYLYPQFVNATFREIRPFIDNLNRKKVYGRSNWRLATPAEAELIAMNLSSNPNIATSETRPSIYDDDHKQYRFIVVCE